MTQWKLTPKKSQEQSVIQALQEAVSSMQVSKWHITDGKPEGGKDGDLALDKNGNLYEKKGEWIKQGSLKGNDGQDGHNPLTMSEHEPTNPIQGDLWYHNGLYVMEKGKWKEISGKPGVDGKNAKNVVIRQNGKIVEWAYENDNNWQPLYDINQLTGKDGKDGVDGKDGQDGKDGREIELRKTKTHIQWRYKDEAWKNLVSLDELKQKVEVFSGGGGGVFVSGIVDIVAGTNITIDKTDPKRPVINATGGGGGAVDSVNGQTGVVVLDKTDIGLGNVDNTSDVNKPISSATQTALDAKVAFAAGTSAVNELPVWYNTTSSQIGVFGGVGIDDEPSRKWLYVRYDGDDSYLNMGVKVEDYGAFIDSDNMDFYVEQNLQIYAEEDIYIGNGQTLTLDAPNINLDGDVEFGGTVNLETDDIAEGSVNKYFQPPEPGGLAFRDNRLNSWYADIDDPTDDVIDLVIIGDSITVYEWVDALENQLATRYNKRTGNTACPTVGFKHASTVTTFTSLRLPNMQGTNTALTFAGFGTIMSNGQACSGTYNCDGVIVLWKENTGTLTVKEGGSGGTTVATIDTSTGSGASNITSIDLGSYGSKEIWIGSTGATTLEGIYPTVGNRTAGIRVWRCGHATYTSNSFHSQPTRAYDFIEKLKAFTGKDPHVIVATGYNDSEANYESHVTNLINGVKARTDGSVALWVAWGQGNGLIRSQIARNLSETLDVALIDSGKALGDVSFGANAMELSPDQAHPNRNGAVAIMMHAMSILTGDPVGTVATNIFQKHQHIGGVIKDTDAGRIVVDEIAGLPITALYKDKADALPEAAIAPSSISALLPSMGGAGLLLGAGGANPPDVYVYRSGAAELTVDGVIKTTGDIDLATTKRIKVNGNDITPRVLTAIIANGGDELAVGEVKRARMSVPYSCKIVKWRITSLDDTSGSVVLDVWKNTYANYPATNSDSITASAKPTVSSDVKAESSTLTGWTVNLDAGDCLGFEVESVTDFEDIKLELFIEPR